MLECLPLLARRLRTPRRLMIRNFESPVSEGFTNNRLYEENRVCNVDSKEFYTKLFLFVAAFVLVGVVLVLLRLS